MILTRPAIADDRPFILSGWSRSFRHGADQDLVPKRQYATTYRPFFESLLDHSNVLVAHGEDVLFGFISYDPSTYVTVLDGRRATLSGYVLYVYVAEPFRRRGIARRLFAEAGISPLQRFGYACRTRWSWKLRSKISIAEYEPNRACYEETQHVRRTETTGTTEADRSDPGQKDLAP